MTSMTADPIAPSLHTTATTTTVKPATGVGTTSATPTAQGASPQAQIKRCCAALHKQSQQASAQQAQLGQAAVACDAIVAAMGGAAPQLDQVKALLAGVALPPVCQGL